MHVNQYKKAAKVFARSVLFGFSCIVVCSIAHTHGHTHRRASSSIFHLKTTLNGGNHWQLCAVAHTFTIKRLHTASHSCPSLASQLTHTARYPWTRCCTPLQINEKSSRSCWLWQGGGLLRKAQRKCMIRDGLKKKCSCPNLTRAPSSVSVLSIVCNFEPIVVYIF